MNSGLAGALEKFRAKDAPLSQVFAPGKSYEVPMFQRGYSWTREEVEQLLDDLQNALKSGEGDYFLGALVLRPQLGGGTVIIDGQQRLATLTILLAVLRDRLGELGATEDAQEVQRDIWPIRFGEKLERIVKLRDPDDHEFRTSIQDFPPQPVAGSHSLLAKVHQLIASRVRGSGTDDGQPFLRDECIRWINFVRDAIRFVLIEVNDEVSAYTVFETLNDRGLDLAVEDLLRNHLCHKSRSEEEAKSEVMPLWEEMIRVLREADVRPSVFLRHYWMSQWEPVTKQSLYREYRRYIESMKLKPKQFAQSLLASARAYAEIVESRLNEPASEHLHNLAELGATQCLPFLLAVYESKTHKKCFAEAAHLAESLTVLYSVLGDKNPNRLERKYSEWARAIRKSTNTFDGIREEASLLPDAAVISQTLEKDPPREFSPAEAKFLLRKITKHELSGELELPKSRKAIHVDHVTARRPAAGVAISYPDRLGNLTLLLSTWNQAMSNKPFADKKVRYRDSKIPMTSRLAAFENFGEAEMREREKEFARIAQEIWHF